MTKQHILVVDDEHGVRDAVCLFLRSQGYLVTPATSGRSALEALSRSAIDLVVLDVSLGYENGLGLLGEIKAKFPPVPVIVFTAWGYEEDLWQTARARGADAYTSKGLLGKQLLMDIHRVLQPRKAA